MRFCLCALLFSTRLMTLSGRHNLVWLLNHPQLIHTHLGRLDLDIAVYWSPWIEKGATEEKVAETDLLLACLYEPLKQGWEAD